MNRRPLPYQGSALPLSYNSFLKSAACHIQRTNFFYTRKVPYFKGTFKSKRNEYTSFSNLLSVIYGISNFSSNKLSERRVSNPQPPAWKAGALPIELLSLVNLLCNYHSYAVGTGGFEPPKSKQQIYSLSHLATLVYPLKKRAEEGTRTPDLLITNQWLYQLSYFGLFFYF